MKSEKFENVALAITMAGTLIMSGAVILSLVRILVFLAVPLFLPMVFAQTTPATRLQAAIEKEQVDGNVKSAMDVYQKIAADNSAPRSVRAKALLQLAGSYEKLGQQAQKVYEQIVRDFASEPAAAQARIRLAALRQTERAAEPAAMTQRRIEVPSFSRSPAIAIITTDGQRVVYWDEATGAVVIGDSKGRDKRVIFKPRAGEVAFPAPSRDLSVVGMAMGRPDGSGRRLAVIKTDGTGYHEIGSGFSGPCLPEWSWDNRYILLCDTQPDGTNQLVRFSVADGEIRRLRMADSYGFYRFSPDGRFIAHGGSYFGQVLVQPDQGGEPQLVSDRARLLDWTSDGRYLAVAMDRSGSTALYLLPIKDGKPAGDPIFVRSGSFDFGRTAASGALIYQTTSPVGNSPFWLGTLDSDGRVGGWKQLNLSGSNLVPTEPGWSPDSTQIVYAASDEAVGQNTYVVRLRNIATGEERELYRGGPERLFCIRAAHHPNLFCGQYPPPNNNITEVLSISIDSGRVERLGSLPGMNPLLFTSPDDRAIYMRRWTPKDELIRWEIGTQQTTTLDQSPGLILEGAASPDERWVARQEKGKIEIRPLSGGDWKPLSSFGGINQIAFTHDGNWLLYHDVDAAGKQSLFRVATAGGQPQRLGDFPSDSLSGYLWISPDGKKIIAQTGNAAETWLLENFVPAAK